MANNARPGAGRPANSKNKTTYRYEVIVNGKKTLCRSHSEVAELLSVSKDTVARKLRRPEIVLQKYKHTNLDINRVNLPIYTAAVY